MNLRDQVREYLIEENFDAVLELLKTQNELSQREKDELVLIAQLLKQFRLNRGSQLTIEEADVDALV